MNQRAWWRQSVGYQVYLRSFADADGDGVGDLEGLRRRLDHLVDLGVDLVWITPFYPSPMADYGYDVADYCDVDPLFGDLADLDALVADAHRLGLRIVVDLVPNHTSIAHPWFRSALDDPTGPYRDFYLWRDPAPDGGPPNNWVSYFGGPAWTLDPASGQYYCHLFLPEQPDLNWRNPAVRDAFDDVLRFWLDRGVDGFRIDVAQSVLKDPDLRDNPQIGPWDPDAARHEQWDAFRHEHDIVQPDVAEIYRRWRGITEPRGAVLIGETYVLDPDELATLVPGDGLDLGFWFAPMHLDWCGDEVRDTLEAPLRALADPTMVSWVASSHDEPRAATRFGGGDLGRRRALALSTLLFGMPGLPLLYQGEELGLVDGVVANHQRADPVGSDVGASRDGCRTPMPWSPGPNFGFSTAATTWLPLGGRVDADTVAVQRDDPSSWLARYRALVAARRALPDLIDAPVEWLSPGEDLIAYRRGDVVVAANVGRRPAELGDITGEVAFDTAGRTGAVEGRWLLEPGEASIVAGATAARAAGSSHE